MLDQVRTCSHRRLLRVNVLQSIAVENLLGVGFLMQVHIAIGLLMYVHPQVVSTEAEVCHVNT